MNRRTQPPLREFPVEQSPRGEEGSGEQRPSAAPEGRAAPELLARVSGISEQDSPLERALGPSCFFSLVIVFLLLMAFRRLLQLPLPALGVLVLVVWAITLDILVRSRPIHISDD